MLYPLSYEGLNRDCSRRGRRSARPPTHFRGSPISPKTVPVPPSAVSRRRLGAGPAVSRPGWANSEKAATTSLKLLTIFEKEAITELNRSYAVARVSSASMR